MTHISALPIDHPAAQKLPPILKSSAPISVDLEACRPFNDCYFNVRNHCSENGGSPVYGWKLQVFGNTIVEAVHHAVWRNANGQLIDVTQPSEVYDADSGLTFCIAPFFIWNDDLPPFIPNAYFHPVIDIQPLVWKHREIIAHKAMLFKAARLEGRSISQKEIEEINRLHEDEAHMKHDICLRWSRMITAS